MAKAKAVHCADLYPSNKAALESAGVASTGVFLFTTLSNTIVVIVNPNAVPI